MQRWRVRRRDETPSVGAGIAFLAVGLVAGLALGTYLADRLGGVGGISARVRGRVGNAGGRRGKSDGPESHAEPDAEPVEERAAFDHEYQEHEEWSAVDLGHDSALGEEADELGDGADEDGDMDDEDTEVFTSADPELEDRVLAAFSNDPVLCERAIDIGAIGPSTIELTGMVYTDDEYEHATVVTRGTPGVETVVNRLSVREDDAFHRAIGPSLQRWRPPVYRSALGERARWDGPSPARHVARRRSARRPESAAGKSDPGRRGSGARCRR